MGHDDDINTSIAHIVLCCLAGQGLGGLGGNCYTPSGMHLNFFIYGVLGFLHDQSENFGNNYAEVYITSLKATRYLPLPCLNADLRAGNRSLSALHLFIGLIPFILSLGGDENSQLANLVIAVNIISLCQYSVDHNKEWGWYTAGAGVFAYFVAPKMRQRLMYPLGLGLIVYCANRCCYTSFSF